MKTYNAARSCPLLITYTTICYACYCYTVSIHPFHSWPQDLLRVVPTCQQPPASALVLAGGWVALLVRPRASARAAARAAAAGTAALPVCLHRTGRARAGGGTRGRTRGGTRGRAGARPGRRRRLRVGVVPGEEKEEKEEKERRGQRLVQCISLHHSVTTALPPYDYLELTRVDTARS